MNLFTYTTLCGLLIISFCATAQEEIPVIRYSNHYVALKLNALNKYNSRLDRQQQQLLKRLKRKEKHFSDKLKHNDSLAYARYRQQALSFDSISHMSGDSATLSAAPHRKNAVIDSLKGVASFAQSQGLQASSSPALQQISAEQTQLNYHNYINELIARRLNYLKSLNSNPSSDIPGITGMEKQVYYAKARMGVFKQMEEDPSKAEDKALEYLEGTPGFDKSMNTAMAGPNSMQGLSPNTSSTDLEKMGFQTQSMVQGSLQQKFGSNLGSAASQMQSQVSQWQSQMNKASQAISDAKQTSQNLKQLRHTHKPSFKVNPMRGLPFGRRIEKQYNYATVRPVPGSTPALLNIAAMAGYRQSPKFTIGAGIASSLGLGQDWNHVQFSMQGAGVRTYLSWLWQYGIGLYGGYERMFKQAVFTGAATTNADITPTAHNTGSYSESLLLGLTKSYRMNDKWNGQIQILFDAWWKQEGLRSPIILRFANVKM